MVIRPRLHDADVEQHDVIHRIATFDDAFDTEGFSFAVVFHQGDVVAEIEFELAGEGFAEHGVPVVEINANPAALHLPVGDERGQRGEINADQCHRFAFAARHGVEVGAGSVIKRGRHGSGDAAVFGEGEGLFVFAAEVEVGAEGTQLAAHFFVDVKVDGCHGGDDGGTDGKRGDDGEGAPPFVAQGFAGQQPTHVVIFHRAPRWELDGQCCAPGTRCR